MSIKIVPIRESNNETKIKKEATSAASWKSSSWDVDYLVARTESRQQPQAAARSHYDSPSNDHLEFGYRGCDLACRAAGVEVVLP